MYVVRQSEQHFIDVLYTDIIVNPNLLVFPLLSPPPPPDPVGFLWTTQQKQKV